MKFQNIVKRNKSNIAFVVGNGINRYSSSERTNSWDQLLIQLLKDSPSPLKKGQIPKGISFTEFYDVLDVWRSKTSDSTSLQKDFCKLMSSWTPKEHHKLFTGWAMENNSPILTTNFENTLGESYGLKLRRNSNRNFTDFYPWESYFSKNKISDPAHEFGIWHINGMQRYYRSIRLGLTHYMGSVERARKLSHKGGLFSGNNEKSWMGSDTWLHVIFHKPIAIFGLELGQTEVFLRWLLIERAKYFSSFPKRKKRAWYFYTGNSQSPGKLLFLKSMGIEVIQVENYDELYSVPWITS